MAFQNEGGEEGGAFAPLIFEGLPYPRIWPAFENAVPEKLAAADQILSIANGPPLAVDCGWHNKKNNQMVGP